MRLIINDILNFFVEKQKGYFILLYDFDYRTILSCRAGLMQVYPAITAEPKKTDRMVKVQEQRVYLLMVRFSMAKYSSISLLFENQYACLMI